jgi:hypothetical protein
MPPHTDGPHRHAASDEAFPTMTYRTLLPLFAALLFASAGPACAQATEVAGVKFDDTITLAQTRLTLNGAGVRYKAIFKVYAAGLYLSAKATTPEAIVATGGPKRLRIVMLREIDAEELGRLFTRGMEDNAPREDFARSLNGIMRMSEIFSSRHKLAAGEAFSVDWIPGTGTVIVVDGKPAGEPIKEPEFFGALMSIWFGKHPADATLKNALLGKPTANINPSNS